MKSYGAVSSRSLDADEEMMKEQQFKQRNATGHHRAILSLALVIVVAVFSVCAYKSYSTGSLISLLNFANEEVQSVSSPRQKSSKKYTEFSDEDEMWTYSMKRVGYDVIPVMLKKNYFQYAFLSEYTGVIEPYVSMTVYIDDDSEWDDGVSYKYSIYNKTDDATLFSGYYIPKENVTDAFSVACTPYDSFRVTVMKYIDDVKVNSKKGELICLYVRRELRELREADVTTIMDAMYSMWEYDEEEGQEKFGENFHNSYYFSETHNFNAAWRDADHIHEGMGFMPQHIKMTNMYEASMQAYDPSVSLFFWDFTIETVEEITIFDSPYFQESTFGKLYPAYNDTLGWTYQYDDINRARILNGRWKNLHAEANQKYPDLENGYGYMRGPWNMNPSKYITRFATTYAGLPGCGNYKTWLGVTDFEEFMKLAPYAPHSTTHTSIGGVYGCDVFDNMTAAGLIRDTQSQLEICQKWGFYVKEMYRGNYLTPLTNCSLDTQECGFECNQNKDSLDDMLMMMRSTISLNQFVPVNLTNDEWELWRDFVCNGDAYKIFVGDHLESASPSDPSFWPIHPTQERLLQAKYMVGGFDDYTWPVTASNGSYVCNHAECYEYDDGVKDYFVDCCYGHYEFDQLLDFYHGNKSAGIGPTNAEVLAALNAGSDDYSMPYIYSSFDWDHCGDDIVAEGARMWSQMVKGSQVNSDGSDDENVTAV